MNLFWFGVLIGGVTMFMSMTLVFAQAVDEKDRELRYLRRSLARLAKQVRDSQ